MLLILGPFARDDIFGRHSTLDALSFWHAGAYTDSQGCQCRAIYEIASSHFLIKAAMNCQNALRVFTKDELPQGWAWAQMNLANALMEQGESDRGQEAKEMKAQAVEAYHLALEVYTMEDFPYDQEVPRAVPERSAKVRRPKIGSANY